MAKLPAPTVRSTSRPAPGPVVVPPASPPAKKFCNDPTHQKVADCLEAARRHSVPVSGTQSCLFVAVKNTLLILDRLWNLPVDELERNDMVYVWDVFQKMFEPCAEYYLRHQNHRDIAYAILRWYGRLANETVAGWAMVALSVSRATDPVDDYDVVMVHLRKYPVLSQLVATIKEGATPWIDETS